MKKTTKMIMIIFTIVILAIVAIYLGVSVYFNTHFFPGSVINGIDCSSKTVEEAEAMIAEEVQDYTLLIKERDDKKETIAGSEMSFEYVSDGAVQALKDTQNSFLWLAAYFKPETYSMTAQTTYDKKQLREAMEKLDAFNEDKIIKPEDAYIKETPSGYQMVEEVEGNELDADKVYEALTEAVDAGQTEVDLTQGDFYKKPSVTSDDENLNKKLSTLQKYEKMTVTYNIGDQQEILDSKTIMSWMTVSDEGEASFDWNMIADWMTQMTEQYDTFGKEQPFHTSLGEDIMVKSQTYGWLIDEATEVEELLKLLEKGESAEREPVYLESARARGENDIGDTYVEIDYTNQRMWFYKDGELLVDTPIVTGNASKEWDSPEGLFCIYGKDTYAVLKGEDYKTPVDFWLPFADDVGIHDAKWRSDFGGQIYKTSGSHGCINTPWEQAKVIYENIEIGVPVVCYSASKDLGQGSVNIPQPAETRVLDENGNDIGPTAGE